MKKNLKKPLHLIIDGPDKSGKSTVCRMLSKELGLRVVKMGNMKEHLKINPELASQAFNESMYNFADVEFIMDRGYPSSMVYSYVFGRNYDLSYLKQFDKIIKPIVVILHSKPRIEDDVYDGTDLELIRDVYIHRAKTEGWHIIDTTDLTPKQVCSEILNLL